VTTKNLTWHKIAACRANKDRLLSFGKNAGTGAKTGEDILVAFNPEIFAADFHRDDFLIAHGRREAAAPQSVHC
jgi:hypothetical protein